MMECRPAETQKFLLVDASSVGHRLRSGVPKFLPDYFSAIF
jgi:hypothetical protein